MDTEGAEPALEGSFTVGGRPVKTEFELFKLHAVPPYKNPDLDGKYGAEQRRIAGGGMPKALWKSAHSASTA